MISRILKISALFVVFAVIGAISVFIMLTLIVKSEDTVVVPQLEGKDVVEVLRTLTDLGLNTKVESSEYSSDIPLNHVIFQDPSVGAEIKKGRDIRIVVSKGPQMVVVPNVVSLPIQQGFVVLEQNDLCEGKKSFTYTENIKEEKIIAQTPSPGLSVKRGECVDVLVSAGLRPSAFKMPDLKGLSVEDAILLIERNNLLLGDIKSVYRKGKPLNSVVSQTPSAGYRVMESAVVNIEANRTKAAGDISDFEIHRGIGLLTYKTDSGFLNNRIRVTLRQSGFSYEIFDDFIKPGKENWFLIPKGDDATVFIYKDNELVETRAFNN